MYDNTIEFLVRGPKALFTDPVTRTGGEKFSYRVPTYSALKGICEQIYSKPTLIWVVDSVRIMNPIRNMCMSKRLLSLRGKTDLAYYGYLQDVCYQVRAHFEWNYNRPNLAQDRIPRKHAAIALRSVRRGGRLPVYLGTSDCAALVEPCKFGEGEGYYDNFNKDFGIMFHGTTFASEAIRPEDKDKLTVRFWNAQMKNGIIDFIRPEDCPIQRYVRDDFVYPFGEDKEVVDIDAIERELAEETETSAGEELPPQASESSVDGMYESSVPTENNRYTGGIIT